MFSIKGRIVTVVALTVSLVAMATGQQSSTRPPAPAQPAAAQPSTPVAVPIAPRPLTQPQLTTTRGATPAAAAPVAPKVLTSTRAQTALQPAAAHPSIAVSVTVTIASRSQTQPQLMTTRGATPIAAVPVAADVQATTRAQAAPPSSPGQPSTPAAVSLAAPRSAYQPGSVQTTTPGVAPPAAEFWQQSPRPSTTRPKPAAAQTPTAAPRSPDYVEEKGFKGKVFEVKHRDADSLSIVLRPLGSGFKGATLATNNQYNTVTVRDFPENIAAIEEAIKRLDTPETPSPDIEFTVHILIASNSEVSASDLPSDLSTVVLQLKSTLRYKNYVLMTSAIHRGKEGGSGQLTNSGIADSKLLGVSTPQSNPIFYNYSLTRISLDAVTTSPRVQVGAFHFGMRAPLVMGNDGKIVYENIGFNTPVAVREGEKVVVGMTSMGDKGLIVVLSAKVLK